MKETPRIDVAYVAKLARINLAADDMARLQAEMETIVGYVDQLSELDVEGIEATAHAAPRTNVWREDLAGESFSRDEMLKNAPQNLDDELIKVPPVIPGGEGG